MKLVMGVMVGLIAASVISSQAKAVPPGGLRAQPRHMHAHRAPAYAVQRGYQHHQPYYPYRGYYYPPPFNYPSAWFQRPYPYHLDYHLLRAGRSPHDYEGTHYGDRLHYRETYEGEAGPPPPPEQYDERPALEHGESGGSEPREN